MGDEKGYPETTCIYFTEDDLVLYSKTSPCKLLQAVHGKTPGVTVLPHRLEGRSRAGLEMDMKRQAADFMRLHPHVGLDYTSSYASYSRYQPTCALQSYFLSKTLAFFSVSQLLS